MAPKPDPATGSSATTRSQKKRDPEETVPESIVPPSETGGEESWADILRNIYQGQEKLSAKIDAHRIDTSNQIEELTSRMSRVELSSQSESAPSVAPITSSRPISDDARLNPAGDARTASTSTTVPLATERMSHDFRDSRIVGGPYRYDVIGRPE
ncbi:hypothetical protein CF319_g9275 [Tilletia indica]|uniref:Uncharacterized protein n=1 Tax=Tilletia indica TaxID=43049 RepID=A0A177SY97_9BASI|nr:hypothetical protein CF319_g9275 [Tilletia indica]KAE8236969.1 hypothetical protein A4X13_0g8966 [Tilletia indica]